MTELCDIAVRHSTDKGPNGWGYTREYYRLFADKRHSIKTVLEVGVWQGFSMRTWRDFFPTAMVFGIDIDAGCQVVGEDRIKTFCCDGYDPSVMANVLTEIGEIDFFVDDAQHYMPQQADLLRLIWPHIRMGGIYAIEECRDDSIASLQAAIAALPRVVRDEVIYAKEGYSLTLLHKGHR